jgi:hypothetical protein
MARDKQGSFEPPGDLAEAMAQLRTFWRGDFPFQGGSPGVLERLEAGFGRRFPEPLARYLSSAVPAERVALEGVGNPIEIWPRDELTTAPLGYRVDTKGQILPGWSPGWFILADEGADPVIVDLDASSGESCRVLQAMHGTGEWEFEPVADSIGQCLLVASAFHHALTMGDDPIVDGAGGLELAEPAAGWLFPRVRGWAPDHSEHWLGVFRNGGRG